MSRRTIAAFALAAVGVLAIPFATVLGQDGDDTAPNVFAATELTSAFTYQGRLTDAGELADGPYDLRFILFDAAAGGAQVGDILVREDVAITDGFFSTQLDFGAGAFNGDARWLEVAIRTGASTGDFTVLNPRQPLSAVPYALHAMSASTIGVPFAASGASEILTGLFELQQTGQGAGLEVTRSNTEAGVPSPAILASNAGPGPAVQALSAYAGGTALSASAGGAGSIAADLSAETAVQLDGAISVTGAAPPAFVHAVAADNLCGSNSSTVIDHPLLNGDPTAIVFVTYSAPVGTYEGPATPIGVTYDDGDLGCETGRWLIFTGDISDVLSEGWTFNVLVIKQ